ncbi:MAG TPA: trehalose-6-phosphate synthase [Candidatus Dormibacteraeota bacterium]|nr:trehalose-6-phosphate synthase [Candidatus Dormibacteraeota bacterium]
MARTLPGRAAILVSNRGPQDVREDGTFRRGAGGVVTALLSLAEATAAEWVACARTDVERSHAEASPGGFKVRLARGTGRLHYASPSREQYDMYYSVISNPVLWFIQHYLWDLGNEPIIDERIHRAWSDGYVSVNEQMAAKVIEVAQAAAQPALVLVQDYQLYLVPRLVRDAIPQAMIQHFVHVPWPTPQYWKVLPKNMRDPILDGLLGCDIVGFQSSLDVRNFLLTCEENLGLQVDEHERAVVAGGRVVYARHYPISVDVDTTTGLASSRGVHRLEDDVARWRPPYLIVRIDRTDPSKNIVRGFIAYEKMLRYHPELRGKVQFWAFLQPSRQDVLLYVRYLRQIRQAAARINSDLGSAEWEPIRLEVAESERKAIAALKSFDVLLVNPVYDGLNLVAKEGALVNEKDGVIVLSENAGAHEELRGNVLSINPFDVEATAGQLYAGLTMPVEERRAMNQRAREVVRNNDIARWISNQVQDLRDLVAAKPAG